MFNKNRILLVCIQIFICSHGPEAVKLHEIRGVVNGDSLISSVTWKNSRNSSASSFCPFQILHQDTPANFNSPLCWRKDKEASASSSGQPTLLYLYILTGLNFCNLVWTIETIKTVPIIMIKSIAYVLWLIHLAITWPIFFLKKFDYAIKFNGSVKLLNPLIEPNYKSDV